MTKEYGILWTDGIYLKEILKKRKPQINSRFKKLEKLAESKGLYFEKLDIYYDGLKYEVCAKEPDNQGTACCKNFNDVDSIILGWRVA